MRTGGCFLLVAFLVLNLAWVIGLGYWRVHTNSQRASFWLLPSIPLGVIVISVIGILVFANFFAR